MITIDETSNINPPNYSRTNPYISKIIDKKKLSKAGSTKETYHICLAIDERLRFEPGDSIGIFPKNPISEVEWVLSSLQSSQEESSSFFQLLLKKNFQLITLKLIDFLQNFISDEKQAQLKEHLQHEGYLKTHDLLSFLNEYPIVKPIDIALFIEKLSPITPRFYSIASDRLTHPNELHLLVNTFTYEVRGRKVCGLGSSFLCHQKLMQPIELFIHPSKTFNLPHDDTPIIMIGPGTGVAPFKAFIERRVHMNQPNNWLFFGERNRASDFYYEELLTSFVDEGKLRLSLAFSRDQEEKIYVQDCMVKEIDLFYQWLTDGAICYICGDAKNMAKDVQEAFCKIFSIKENLSYEESLEKFKQEKKLQKIRFEVY